MGSGPNLQATLTQTLKEFMLCPHRASTQEKSHSSDPLIMILTLAKPKIFLLPPMGKAEHPAKVKKETEHSSS